MTRLAERLAEIEPSEEQIDVMAIAICELRMQRHNRASHCCRLEPGRCVHRNNVREDARAAWRAFAEAL